MNFDDIKGRAVITIDEGERVGSIADAVLDFGQRRVIAFTVTSGGIIGGSKHTLDIAAIHKVGPDAITVLQSTALREGDDVADGLTRLSDLRQRNIITESGQEIGRVSDVQLDEATYDVLALETKSGSRLLPMVGNRGTVPVSEVVSFGGDVVTVRDSAAPALPPGDTPAP